LAISVILALTYEICFVILLFSSGRRRAGGQKSEIRNWRQEMLRCGNAENTKDPENENGVDFPIKWNGIF
jgi:hypothetical protein